MTTNLSNAEKPTIVGETTWGKASLPMTVRVHMSNYGNLIFTGDQFAGVRGERLEGFSLSLGVPGLTLRYMAHLQERGDVDYITEPYFIGTEDEERRLEGFAIVLEGPASQNFDVAYKAWHPNPPYETGFFFNGAFCGTRGLGRTIEGILVRVVPK